MAAIAGKKADIYVTSTPGVALTDEAMSDVSANVPGALVRTYYAVTNNVKRYIDPSLVPVFQISLNSGGSWSTATPDFVYPGAIGFIASQQSSPAAMFRVHSGNYLPYARVGGGHEWTLTPTIDLFDATEFGFTSKKRVAGVGDRTIQIKRYFLDDTVRALLASATAPKLVMVLYTDATTQPTGPRYETYARLKQDSIKTPTKGVIEEDATFMGDGDALFLSA